MGRAYRLKELATFLSAPRGSALYCGFVGYNNLGDEVLWQRIKGAFAPMRLVCAPPILRGWRKPLMDLRKYDPVILGGGTLIGGDLPDGSNPFREHFQWFHSRARHAIAFGTGVGQLSENAADNAWLLAWKPSLEKFEYIGVRGPLSVQSLSSIGIDAEQLGDPACLLAQDPGFWSPRRTRVLGVNIGEVPQRSAVDAEYQRNYVDALARVISEKARAGWKIEFFAVIPSDCSFIDEVIHRSSLSNCIIHKIYHDGKYYIDKVKYINIFIGMKLHSVILAMCAGVPSIMVSYASKCRDFMMSVELDAMAIDIAQVSPDALNDKLEGLLLTENEIGGHLAKRMSDYRVKQLARADEIRARHSKQARARPLTLDGV